MSKSRDAADQINRVNSSAANATAITIDSSENVGIGTSSAARKLEVSANNNAGAKANYIRITDTDTTATAGNQQGGIEFFSNDVTPGIAASIEVLYAGSGGGGQLTFNTNVNSQGTLTEAVRIDENGNVGIGATNADSPLTIQPAAQGVGTNNVQSWMYALTSGSEFDLKLNQVVSSGLVKYAFTLRNNGTSYANNLVLDRGNVGIGTSSPLSKLDVSNSFITVSKGAATTGRIGASDYIVGGTDNDFVVQSSGTGVTRFVQSSTEAMRIGSDGTKNFGVHQDSSGGFNIFAGAGSAASFAARFDGTGTGASNVVQFVNGYGQVGSISLNGSSTAYNTSSDYRLKTDAQPMTGASARVQALNPVNFEWIANGSRVDGFLAHEAQAVVPEAVHGTKDAMRDEEYEVTPAVEATYDDDGNELTAAVEAVMGTRSVPDYQGIDQSKLVPLLTAALQEALTEITDLKARVVALEAV